MTDELALSILAINFLVSTVMFVFSCALLAVENSDIYRMVNLVPVLLPLTFDLSQLRFFDARADAYGSLNATTSGSEVRGSSLATIVRSLPGRQIG